MWASVATVTLKTGYVDYKAVKFACRAWHYSRTVPAGKLVKIGVWESDKFIGVVLFSRGATLQIGWPYDLAPTEVCELTRIALDVHLAPVSQIVSQSIKMLRKHSPGLRLIVSYAAVEEGHHGGIYQAGNWIYEGTIKSHAYLIKGKMTHVRSVGAKYQQGSIDWIRQNVDPNAKAVRDLIRHKYLMPLDRKMRRAVLPRHQPYPKPMET